MKKLLVLLVSIGLILSVSAVSLASLDVRGDFRYKYYSNVDKNTGGEDEVNDGHDLRVEVIGKFGDQIVAYVKLRDVGTRGDDADFYADEFWVSYKTNYATFKMGDFEWKLTPSRSILKANNTYIFPRTDTLLTADIPLPKGFFTGFAYAADGTGADSSVQDGGYDLKFGYANQIAGGEIHYFDSASELASARKTNLALDGWYKPLTHLKVYAVRNDPEFVDDATYGADAETLIGAYLDHLAGTPFGIRAEYIVTDRLSRNKEFNPWGVNLEWLFNKQFSVDLETTNYITTASEEEITSVLTFKLKF